MNREIARENLLFIKMVLDDNKVKFRLGFGTLLGCVRENDFILNDKDIDLVLEQEYYSSVFCLLPLFKQSGFEVTILKNHYLTLKRRGVSIDFYFFSKRNFADYFFNRVTCAYGLWCIYFKDYYFSIWEERFFLGKQFDCIPESWLYYTYGNWFIPSDCRGSKSRTFTSKWFLKIRDFIRSFMSKELEERFRVFYRSCFK